MFGKGSFHIAEREPSHLEIYDCDLHETSEWPNFCLKTEVEEGRKKRGLGRGGRRGCRSKRGNEKWVVHRG